MQNMREIDRLKISENKREKKLKDTLIVYNNNNF